MNNVMVIHPYKKGNTWVFDDANFGLKAEAFVYGMTEIIDKVVKNKGLKRVKKLTLIFSESPLPQSDICLKFVRPDVTGNWYFSKELDMEGWLCPALFHYFEKAPKTIYAKISKYK